ncbi:hypothetical protein SAMN02746069_01594 [Legionella israelensis DSM 19235]|nr:hypothetical protein SAMN02746069_01594 [Legionella israelensis DSM 19235]
MSISTVNSRGLTMAPMKARRLTGPRPCLIQLLNLVKSQI